MKNDFEDQKRKKFFNEITAKKKIIQKEINQGKKIARKVRITNNPDNIARVAFKKVSTNLVPEFRKAGLDFYSKSSVSTAIRKQLLAYVNKGHHLLQEYTSNLNMGKKNISSENLRDDSIELAQDKLNQYNELNEKIENYNLRDNIVDTILDFLCPDNDFVQLGIVVPHMIASDIAPTLTKLGLGDLVPELKQKLIEKYSEIGKDSYVDPEVDIPYYEEQAFSHEHLHSQEAYDDEEKL